MFGTTGEGWLFSLARDEESAWGGVDDLFNSLMSEQSADGIRVVKSSVWGTLQSTGVQPVRGDGIAFYHSSRARFPSNDAFGRKPRISVIGELLEDAT